MKVYKSSRNTIKWYKKIDWIRLVVLIVLFFSFSLGIFYLLSQGKNFEDTLKVSILISLLVGLESILIDLLENRDRVFYINKNKITYIEIHDDKDGKIFTYATYKKMLDGKKLENVYSNIEKYEGIDRGEFLEVIKVKKRMNRTIVKAKVKVDEWDAIGRFTISKMILNEREKYKTFTIMNDYEGYSELIEKIEKIML